MLTLDEAREYLNSLGITLPDSLLSAILDSFESVLPCLETNYPPSTAKLILYYLLSLNGYLSADGQIRSQSAPSGASRSFFFRDFTDRWRGTLSMLRGLDTKNCVGGLIPPDPTGGGAALLVVTGGGCV